VYFLGILIVSISVLAGYIIIGGSLKVLFQPAEFIIILGTGFGGFFASNRKHNLKHAIASMKNALTDKNFGKVEYNDLLAVMYTIFKLVRAKSLTSIEAHIESPLESEIFKRYPTFLRNAPALNLFCDYMRMISMGIENPFIIEDLMREEIDVLKHEALEASVVFQNFADSLPAIGIVAAVLGVIHTMGFIDQPPEVLGHLIGGALVGTFFGILVSYGFLAPLAQRMKQIITVDNQYYDCVKAGIMAYLNNLPPIIAIETARKSIDPEYRPTFNEMEANVNGISI
jgi:chemotaxis protein MotA